MESLKARGDTPPRLLREYIKGLWTVCLSDLDSGVVKTVNLQYMASREREGGRESSRENL